MKGDWAAHLDKDDLLLWQGTPSDKLFVVRPLDLLLVPFSLLWTGISVAILIVGEEMPFPLPLVPVIFVCVGAYLILGRFFVDRHLRRGTRYALTSRRALIATRFFGERLRSQPLTADLSITLRRRGNLGQVTFGPEARMFSGMGRLRLIIGDDGAFTFRALTGAQHVHALARKAQQEQRS